MKLRGGELMRGEEEVGGDELVLKEVGNARKKWRGQGSRGVS